jgi:hypothetical protein
MFGNSCSSHYLDKHLRTDCMDLERNPRMKPTLLLLVLTSSLFAAERPEVTVPRHTSSDTAVQPKW